MLEGFVEQFTAMFDYPIVEPAHMELAEPSIATAFDRCVERGAKRVVVCPYFLLPGKHWDEDIPNLTREAAAKHEAQGIEYLVTAPIGLHPMMKQVIDQRLSYCLSRTQGLVEECESCKGLGTCRFQAVNEG